VGKTVRRWRLGGGTPRVGGGTLLAMPPGVAPLGWPSQTALRERRNLESRQHGAAVGRRGRPLGQPADARRWRWPMSLIMAVCPRRADACRGPSPRPPTAAGLTAQVWTLREVRRCRVLLWPHPVGGEPAVVVGSSQGRGPGLARGVHTAHCEGVIRGERVTGRP